MTNVNPLAAAIGKIVGALAIAMPTKINLASVELAEVKSGNGEKVTNYRLGFSMTEEDAAKFCLTVPVLSADDLAKERGLVLPEEKKGTYVLDPLILDAKDQPVWSANVWYNRETKKGGKAGTMILHQLPIGSIRKFLSDLAESLKDPELKKYMEENNLLSHSNPVEINGVTRTLTILAVPFGFLPKELGLISVYGNVNPKDGTVSFKAVDRFGNWCMGWNPNRIAVIDPTTKTLRSQIRSGEIPTLGGQPNAPRPKNIETMLQNTIDEALKTILAEKKIEKLVVNVVPSRRETAMTARDKLLAATLGASQAPAPATPDNKVPDAPADHQEEPAGATAESNDIAGLFS